MYKVFRCTNCKNYYMSSSKNNFKCLKCGKNINLEKSRILFSSLSPQEASEVLRKIKEEDYKRRNLEESEFDDFKSACDLID